MPSQYRVDLVATSGLGDVSAIHRLFNSGLVAPDQIGAILGKTGTMAASTTSAGLTP